MRLLLQACSGRKIEGPGARPAIELYDGVAYRVIKKYLREHSESARGLEIIILSAEYGLITSETAIENYDRRMNRQRAEYLKLSNGEFWREFIDGKNFSSIFVNVGRDYLPALESISFPGAVQFASGGIGIRNGQLKNWLRG